MVVSYVKIKQQKNNTNANTIQTEMQSIQKYFDKKLHSQHTLFILEIDINDIYAAIDKIKFECLTWHPC